MNPKGDHGDHAGKNENGARSDDEIEVAARLAAITRPSAIKTQPTAIRTTFMGFVLGNA
jgi:hypothetical protein